MSRFHGNMFKSPSFWNALQKVLFSMYVRLKFTTGGGGGGGGVKK